jgi:hypothetical protein
MVHDAQEPMDELLVGVAVKLVETLEGFEMGDLDEVGFADFPLQRPTHVPAGQSA